MKYFKHAENCREFLNKGVCAHMCVYTRHPTRSNLRFLELVAVNCGLLKPHHRLSFIVPINQLIALTNC